MSLSKTRTICKLAPKNFQFRLVIEDVDAGGAGTTTQESLEFYNVISQRTREGESMQEEMDDLCAAIGSLCIFLPEHQNLEMEFWFPSSKV